MGKTKDNSRINYFRIAAGESLPSIKREFYDQDDLRSSTIPGITSR
jgi:hypothetical protein